MDTSKIHLFLLLAGVIVAPGMAIACYVPAFAVGAFVQRSNVHAALEKVDDDGNFPPAYMSASRRIQITCRFLGSRSSRSRS